MQEVTLFEMLRREHDALDDMLAELMHAGTLAYRRDLFNAFQREFTLHSRAEMESLYPSLMTHETTKGIATRAQKEHEKIDEYLMKLNEMDFESSVWESGIKSLKNAIQIHVREEEGELFALLTNSFTKEEIEKLGREFRMAKESTAKAA